MERSDFVDRNGERKVDFMKYWGLIELVYARDHGLKTAELRLLFYLDSIPYFTRLDFLDGTLFYSWDNKRWNKLVKLGWVVKIETAHKRGGGRYHYNVSLKGKRLVNAIYKILCGEAELPKKYKRKREKHNARYSEKVQRGAIEAMEKSKARDRLDDY